MILAFYGMIDESVMMAEKLVVTAFQFLPDYDTSLDRGPSVIQEGICVEQKTVLYLCRRNGRVSVHGNMKT